MIRWERGMDDHKPTWEDLIQGMISGDVRSLAKMITAVENRERGWDEAMKAVYPLSGSACTIGITGSPGAGKSTLTNIIAGRMVDEGLTVGIIAVDPSSPFSGGALLGDRLRMQEVSLLPGVFIRSMATRGILGGLCQAARDVSRILDASGKDVILIETVGVGQDEIEVVRASDFVVLITFPGLGDGIQVIKAGTMEIADLFVVNKADRDGAEEMAAEISAMLGLCTFEDRPVPGVIRTSALEGTGIDDLMAGLFGFVRRRKESSFIRREDVREEILTLLEREISRIVRRELGKNGRLESSVDLILGKKSDPYTAVSSLLPHFVTSLLSGMNREGSRNE